MKNGCEGLQINQQPQDKGGKKWGMRMRDKLVEACPNRPVIEVSKGTQLQFLNMYKKIKKTQRGQTFSNKPLH